MLYKRTNRKIIVLLVISIVSMLIFANFDLTKVLKIKGIETDFYLPVPILFPLFFVFLYTNIHYIKFSYAEGKTYLQKIIFGTINTLITVVIFIVGFNFWKFTDGDVDVAFFGEIKDSFELNFRNVYFWTFYQTVLMIYALSILKILVSKLPKK